MSYTVAIPTHENRIALAWMHVENYLGTRLTQELQAIFIQCSIYQHWSFSLSILGIEGWPVAALWDDMRQTCRDSQS